MAEKRPLEGPSSTILIGDDRVLLNWVAFALASPSDPEFLWTDVRVPGQPIRPTDLLSRTLIPAPRLMVVPTSELAPNERDAGRDVSAVIRSDEAPSDLQRLLDFLRLPLKTQKMLETVPPGGLPRVVVLSNGHRLLAFYSSPDIVARTVRAIVASGVAFLMTFADERPKGREAFDNILHLDGNLTGGWKAAVLTVERWTVGTFLTTGATHRLDEIPAIGRVLAEGLG